jgi:hypothetical protein
MARQQKMHARLDMLLGSLPDQGDHLQASLIDDNIFNNPFKGTTSSFTSVCMNSASHSTNREEDKA